MKGTRAVAPGLADQVDKHAKRRRPRGRPPTRVIKLDATMEEVAQKIFANAKKPDRSMRVRNQENTGVRQQS